MYICITRSFHNAVTPFSALFTASVAIIPAAPMLAQRRIALCAFRRVQTRCQRNAIEVMEGHFSMIDLFAFGEHLVPLLG